MKLTQLHEARYTGAPQSSAIFIKFIGEGDRGGLPVDVVGPFKSNQDAKGYIAALKKETPNLMRHYIKGPGEIEIEPSITPQDWMEKLIMHEEEY